MKTSTAITAITLWAAAATSAYAAQDASAQGALDVALHQKIAKLDSDLFDAFNKCADPAQLQKHATFFSPNTEFYHDNGGVTWTRDAMLANTQKYACGNYTRQLVPDTLRVSPVKDYGAISTGTHRFCQTSSGKCEGAAEFVMIWHDINGTWEVTRSLSYGHRENSVVPGETNRLVESDVAQILKDKRIQSISFAFLRNGMLTYADAFGDAQQGVPATVATLYNIASLAKPISAEVAMQLVARGKISLDEKMSTYWTDPDIARDPRRNLLTPRLALSHRTGFPNWRTKTLSFDRSPGASFSYSGEGFEYLARFIQAKTKHPIDYWAEQLVLAPLGMRQTSYVGQAWFNGRIAFPHDAEGKQLKPQIRKKPMASDDVFSTPTDYAIFISSLMKNRNLSPDLAKERVGIQTDRKADLCKRIPKDDCPSEAGMALGWESFLINGHRYLMHSGSDDGTFTFSYFSADTKSGAVIFTNSSNGSKAILPLLRLSGEDREFVDFLDKLVNP